MSKEIFDIWNTPPSKAKTKFYKGILGNQAQEMLDTFDSGLFLDVASVAILTKLGRIEDKRERLEAARKVTNRLASAMVKFEEEGW